MFNNVGTIDRLIRLILASVLLFLGLYSYAGSALGIGFIVAGAVALLTGLFGFCGLYALLGINTRGGDRKAQS
jgi:ABC-type Na+ efflux pump permease subunit